MEYLENGKIVVDDLDELKKIVRNKTIPLELIDIKESCLTSLSFLFRYVEKINGSIEDWDISSIKNMGSTFEHSSFNCDLSNWNVSNCIDMSYMFANSDFNNDSLRNWNISNVKNMNKMFYWSDFNGDLSNWDVSNVIHMIGTFEYSKFNNDISSWVFNPNIDCYKFIHNNQCFIDKYNNGKQIFHHTNTFLNWFEKNREKMRELNLSEDKVLDFFSFDNNIELNKDY